MDRKYGVVTTVDLYLVDFTELLTKDYSNCVKSVNNSQFIIAWEGAEPTFWGNLTDSIGPLSREECVELVQSSQWQAVEPH